MDTAKTIAFLQIAANAAHPLHMRLSQPATALTMCGPMIIPSSMVALATM
jgi:hypothetical protein